MLLLDSGADVSAVDGAGITPLEYAMMFERVQMARLLIDRGADVGADGQDQDGKPLLFNAAGMEDPAIAHLLIERGADPNAADKWGFTPIFRPVQGIGNLDMVRLLVDKGADVNVRTNSGLTPLAHAADWQNSAIARLLIERGARTDSVDLDWCKNGL